LHPGAPAGILNARSDTRLFMQTPAPDSLSADTVSYEEPPIAELELDGVEYRRGERGSA
jgi:hypothetical protein